MQGAGSSAATRKMAELPEGAQLRVAPGDADGWPVLQLHNVFVLPGVPRIFESQLATVCAHFLDGICGRPLTRRVRLAAAEEPLVEVLQAVAAAHGPAVAVGSYPVDGVERAEIVVTLEARGADELAAALAALLAGLKPEIAETAEVDEQDAVSQPPTPRTKVSPHPRRSPPVRLLAAPRKKGVNSYPTVSVACRKCNELLFRYKKRGGRKTNLIKCYVERIVEDPAGLLDAWSDRTLELKCPSCQSGFARDALIHGRPALKMVGDKVRMRK